MPTVSSHDLQAVLDAVQELHDCRDPADFPAKMRAAVRRLVPGDIVAYSEFDLRELPHAPSDEELDQILHLAQTQPWVKADDDQTTRDIAEVTPSLVRHATEHPLFCLALTEPDPPVAKLSDFLSLREFKRRAVFENFFRPLRATRQIALCPTRCNGVVTGLTVSRSGSDFRERDRLVLQLLSPHIRDAFRAVAERRVLEDQLRLHTSILDSGPSSVMLVEADGRIILQSERASNLMAKAFPASGPRCWLPQTLQFWLSDQCRNLERLDPSGGIQRRAEFETDVGTLSVNFYRSTLGNHRFMLVLSRPDSDAMISSLKSLGLTFREAEVLLQVRRGLTNPQIAKRLKIQPGTVRTHVERILKKLCVGTRSAAALRASEHLAGTGV